MYKNNDGSFTYSPHDLIKYMESEFVTWLDRYNCEFPDELLQDEDSETEKILQKKGYEHEAEYLAELRRSGRDVCSLAKTSDTAKTFAPREELTDAMRAGREVIFQPELRDDLFRGYADFLVRVDGHSMFGDYHYEPWDTKLALKPKPYFLIQLACYSDLLERAQGTLPSLMHVVLGDKTKRSFRTEDYLYFYRQLRQAFSEQQQSFGAKNPPEFSGKEDFGRWTTHVDKLIEDTDHLCRVANIRAIQIRKLKEANIITMAGLASTSLESVHRIESDTFATLKQQARLQVESAGLLRPKYEIVEPQIAGNGLFLLPPHSESDVFFDMEGFPLADGGLEYLFGVTVLEHGKPEFLDWWAHNSEEEKLAFEQFIGWLHARWQKDPSMHVFHYAAYEKTAMRKLMGKYGTKEQEIDALLRNEVFVDLFTVVRQSLKVGTPNYSIKSIEKLYREKRGGEVATGQDSIVFYQRWLDNKDGTDWHSSAILKQIRDYNKEDCDSTWQLAEWLRNVQSEQKIVWKPTEQKESPDSAAAQSRAQAATLAVEMLKDVPDDDELKTEPMRVRELLAHLLEFHWREAKPVFWAKFDRHEMTERELFDDPCCLAGLVLVGRREQPRSFLYDYKFDANQDTKIDAEDSCFFAHDLEQKITVHEIDAEHGTVTLKRVKRGEPPPTQLSLIKDEFVDASEIAQSIYRIATSFMSDGSLPPALDDFMSRRRPRIHGITSGPLISGAQDTITTETIDVLSRMDNTTICIQGPPGSGKTYTAAKSIVKLLLAGKRIGVTSNSHKAIANLLDKVAMEAALDHLDLRAVKLQSDMKDFHVESSLVEAMTPKEFFEDTSSGWHLVGGTVWAFSKEVAAGLVDYLFVDEAGQVSVANLVGMAPSTRNIVLIGDQMQLSQPLKGTHPGDSGKSVLEYLLAEKQVVPEDFGIFLGISWRMHPAVCSFISGAIYEGRLRSHPSTADRVVKIPSTTTEFLTQTAGVMYVPVLHEGNTQDSDEEAETIFRIVRELNQCLVCDYSERPFDVEKDLLIVAPYNMQVRKLRKRIAGARIGSVDKFQGQEAPVLIVSMCSSTGDASPRGLEFIFNKNRLNVAISRAKSLAIVVGSPALARTHCKRIEQMELVNLFCRIVEPSHGLGAAVCEGI